MRRWLWMLLLCAGCDARPTALEVVVESELAAPDEIDAIEIAVDSQGIGGRLQTARVDLSPDAAELPGRLGLSYSGAGPLGPFTIAAIGRRAGEWAVESRLSTAFTDGTSREVRLVLERACAGVVCEAGQACTSGECGATPLDPGAQPPGDAGSLCAPPHLADCDRDPSNGCEVDTRVDRAHCGACFRPCQEDALCTDGVCGCEAPYQDCDPWSAGCEDTSSDHRHCGVCGNACTGLPFTGGTRCIAGACFISSCLRNREDCNEAVEDGCEIDTSSDPAHCGACRRNCRDVLDPSVAATYCAFGVCQIAACAPGRSDCDRFPTNGCEYEGTSCP